MNVVDCYQGDAVWFQCRLGCVTSTRVADAIAKLKRSTGESAARVNMKWEIVGELLTKKPAQHFVSQWMDVGNEREPLARAEYELVTGVSVERVGFVYHPAIKMAGCSPDGLVGADGLIEIKCPKLETHLQYLMESAIPEEYIPQMLWQMACCEREWNDFVSYHPDVPEPYQLFVKRLHGTPEATALMRGMEAEVAQFLEEVDGMLAKLQDSCKREAVCV